MLPLSYVTAGDQYVLGSCATLVYVVSPILTGTKRSALCPCLGYQLPINGRGMAGAVYIKLLGPACGHGFARSDGSIGRFDQDARVRVGLRLLGRLNGLDGFETVRTSDHSRYPAN